MKTIVIKIGGVASDNLTDAFFDQLREWQKENYRIIIVHGGGHYITSMMEKLKLQVEIVQGLRKTDDQALDITKMVLLGQVQPMITTLLQNENFRPIGLNAGCDHLIAGKVIDFSKLGFVGEVTGVNQELLTSLLETNHLPVIAPLGMTETGQWVNINADDVACQVAISTKAEKLFLLTDVPGIKNKNKWLKEISIGKMDELLENQVVTGGMIPKMINAKKAILSGVTSVHINNQITSPGTKISRHLAVAL